MFRLIRSQLKGQVDKSNWQYLGYVQENSHEFWRDEKRRLVLVSCQGEYYHVSAHRGWDLRDISDEWERQLASGLGDDGKWVTVCPYCKQNQTYELVQPKDAFEGLTEHRICSRCGREVKIVWCDKIATGMLWPRFSHGRKTEQ